jgi:hypothetical protein
MRIHSRTIDHGDLGRSRIRQRVKQPHPQSLGVVDEAIEDGVGDGGVGDDLMPMLDRHLAGDDGRSALVAIIDEFEEIATLLAGERGEAPITEDEQVDPRQHLEEPRIASVGERRPSLEDSGLLDKAAKALEDPCDESRAFLSKFLLR